MIELAVSMIIPTLILKKLSGEEQLGSTNSLILALAYPLVYAIYQFAQERKVGFIPVLGFISILLTGSVGLLQLDVKYIAIKEALIPSVIGVATLISLKTRYPIVKTMVYNEMIMKVDLIDSILEDKGNTQKFESALTKATYILALSFLLSAILNYIVAKLVVTSPAGTAEFNDQLGTLTLISYPAIALPSSIVLFVAIYYLFKQATLLTGLKFEELMNVDIDEEKPETPEEK